MNCFEWQNRASDYLDGILIGPPKKEADDHLDTCKDCSERHNHYRQILSSISSQPRSALPVPIRKSPLSSALPRIDLPGRRSAWERLPWFIRTGIEGVGVAFAILFVVALVPRLRTLYERSVEKKLDAFLVQDPSLEARNNDGGGGAPAPLARGKLTPAETKADGHSTADDEFNGEVEDDGEEAPVASGEGDLRVGSSEIWRFNLKTDSPHEIRAKVVQILADLNLPAGTAGLGGIEAPGGIQFDVLVPQSVVAGLKLNLQKLGVPGPGQAAAAAPSAHSPLDEAFTWYKSKSKKKIPSGMSRVVIWLSQL